MPSGMLCNRLYFLTEDGKYEEIGGDLDKKIELSDRDGRANVGTRSGVSKVLVRTAEMRKKCWMGGGEPTLDE